MNVTQTVVGNVLQASQYLGQPYAVDPITTLNTKFNVEKDTAIPAGEIPRAQYLAIGNGGHSATTDPQGFVSINDVLHDPRHTGLYSDIPFVGRPIANDLTAEEQKKYRLRTVETINGEDYVFYYLYKLDVTHTDIKPVIKKKVNGEETEEDYDYDVANLNPDRSDFVNNQVISANGEVIVATSKIPVILDEVEVQEIIDACVIKFNNADAAMISELGVVSGVDHQVANTSGTGPALIDEALGAQICSFLSCFYKLQTGTQKLEFILEVGMGSSLTI